MSDTTKPTTSPELFYIHERLKMVATEYLIAFENDVQDIGTPSTIAQYFIDQVVEQTK